MKARKLVSLAGALVVGLGLTLVTGLLLREPQKAVAAPAGITRYVAPWGDDTGGNECAVAISPCRTVRHATVMADFYSVDTIQVASGVYTATSGPGLFIQASMVVRGGYSSDFSEWDPDLYPTTLDGGSQMRVVYIKGPYTVTLEGLRIVDGYATGGGSSSNGGGIYATEGATPIISRCVISGNHAALQGGGIYLNGTSNARIYGSQLYNNAAQQLGGGLAIYNDSAVEMASNVIASNSVTQTGGLGSGMAVQYSGLDAAHTTIARNSGGNGNGIFAAYGSVVMTNTVLVSNTTALAVASGGYITLTATLWGAGEWANVSEGGSATIYTGTLNWWGDPGFANADGFDYHIGTGSGAFDRGVDPGIDADSDIDGDERPYCDVRDLGADESTCCANLNGTIYSAVQEAIDASSSPVDVVKVAGTCRGVHTRGDDSQVAHITRTLTLRGGYTVSDWDDPDAEANPTRIDGSGLGRPVFILGESAAHVSATVEGLRLTNGCAGNYGGGLYARYVDLLVSDCHVFGNQSPINAGGMQIVQGDAITLVDNLVYTNDAAVDAGGVKVSQCGSAVLSGNQIYGNSAGDDAGGLFVALCTDSLLVNNVVADNEIGSGGEGAGIWLYGGSADLLHGSIAGNGGGDGAGVLVTNDATVAITNTIVASQSVGVLVDTGSVALDGMLWGAGAWDNGADTSGTGISIGSTILYGDPLFVDPASWDYHLGRGSPAINGGVHSGVETDLDGRGRVGYPDIGAYEGGYAVYLPLVLRSY